MSSLSASRPIAYRPRTGALQSARAPIAAAYGLAIALAALLVGHPLLLAALLAGVLAAGFASGVGPQLLRATRRATLPLLLATVVINALVSRDGLTVIARLGDWGVLGQVDVTLEAVIYGAVFGLRLLVVTIACLLVVCAVDPDELLFAFRRISPHSALTATLATRMIPVLGEDARRLAEAQRLRPDGGARGARGKLQILRATVGGALDRSLDVAAVLEMRGYGGAAAGAGRARRAFSRHDLAFAAAAAAVVALAVLAAAVDSSSFHAYPLAFVGFPPSLVAIAVVIVLVCWLPFLDRRGIER